MSGTFSVKNFDKFQHYKDRSPPWIRLYNSLLDDYDFGRLQDASKMHLLAIWLLASRYENRIPFNPEWIARRINATEVVDLDVLVSSGFIVPDEDCSKMLAERKHVASKVLIQSREEQSREDIVLAKAKTHPAGAGPPSKKPKGHPRKVEAYPDAFETLWRAYRPIASPASSKAEALKAWDKLSPEERDACLAGLTRYVAWLSEEKQRRKDTPAKHLATFINKRGWEPFLEGRTLVPSIADEHPDISPERLAEIMADIERDYPDRRIR